MSPPTAHMSRLQERFVASARSRPECFAAFDQRGEGLPGWVRGYSYDLQPWPTFFAARELAQIHRVPTRLARLVAEIPERLFEGDAERLARFYRMGGADQVRDILAARSPSASIVSRVDLIHDGDALRCLEINMSAQIGGWQPRFWAAICLRTECVERFLGEAGIERGDLHYRDPLTGLFDHVVGEILERRRCGALPDDEPLRVIFTLNRQHWDRASAAVLEYMGGLFERHLESAHGGLEGSLEGGFYDEVTVVDGRVRLGGGPVDALVEYDWGGYTHPRVTECQAAGGVLVYNGQQTHLLNDKRNLALLSENAESGVFDAEEREVIQRHVPWTRCVVDGFTEYRGERRYLPDLILDERERLVIKEGRGARGDDVYCGWDTPEERWEDVAEGAEAEGTWVVQERVRSACYEYRHGSEVVPHDVVWGLYTYGHRFGGGFLRMLPLDTASVINSARGATEGIFYEHDSSQSLETT